MAGQAESARGPRIVVVGGGAGGLELATRLGDKLGKRRSGQGAQIVLVDRNPTHIWKPLLHEVAAGSMDPNTHQLEYAAQARWHGFEFQQGELKALDRATKTITVSGCLDALVFFFFAWIALMLAAISLREMHSFLRERMSRAWSEVSVIAICALASFGVYLGRFQRWNSWDIFTRPWALLSHSYAISASIGNDSTPLLFVAIFTAFMYTVYSVMTAILSAHRQS